jgi:hypothetical protein
MRVLGRFLLAATTGLAVLVTGVLSAMALGGFAALERTAPAGNRFLILEFIAIGVLICVPMAIAAACWVLLRTASHPGPELSQSQRGFFLGR